VNAIRIRHCRVRVLRHGGWSWGPQPRRFVDQLTQRLPAWLMQALAEQLADRGPDLAIPRLRLQIPVRMSELRRWIAEPAEQGEAVNGVLAQRVRGQIAAALADVPRRQEAPAWPVADRPAQEAANDETSSSAVIEALIAWQRAGNLARVIACTDSATLRAWARAMLDEMAVGGHVPEFALARLAVRVQRIEAVLDADQAPAASLAQAFVDLVDVLVTPQPGAAADEIARGIAADTSPPVPGDAAPASSPAARSMHAPHRPAQARARTRALPARQANRQSVAVDSVLPFIVTGVLARRGYVAGLRAALACADRLDDAGCFGAALACKLSPPPHRGWERSPATARLAAVMSGLDEPPDNARMDGFLRGLSSVCAPLDASLWPASRAARKQPGILVDRLDGQTWVAFDIASSQPIGWFGTSDEVLRVDDLLPGRLWWLAPGAADSDLPDALVGRALHAVALGPQPRAPGWQRAGEMLWTSEPLLRRHAAELLRVFDEARELLAATHSAFIERRPLVIPACGSASRAEFSVTLAVCSALGEIADTLWHEREPTPALLALSRLGDLGGTVSIEDSRVLVRPALGLRFMDLGKHGFLRDIAGVPWWPGRRVEFAGP